MGAFAGCRLPSGPAEPARGAAADRAGSLCADPARLSLSGRKQPCAGYAGPCQAADGRHGRAAAGRLCRGQRVFGAGAEVPLGGGALGRRQPARLPGGVCRSFAGEPEPAAAAHPHARPCAGGAAGRYRRQNRICPLLLQKQGRPGHGAPRAQNAGRCKTGTAAGFQLFRAVAAAQLGPAVHAGELHRAPGRRGGKALRGQDHRTGQRQPVGHGAAGPFLREL